MTTNTTQELDQVRSEVRDHYAQRAQTAGVPPPPAAAAQQRRRLLQRR